MSKEIAESGYQLSKTFAMAHLYTGSDFYRYRDHVLYLGNGLRRRVNDLPRVIAMTAGGGGGDDGGPAVEARLDGPSDVAVGPGGEVYIKDTCIGCGNCARTPCVASTCSSES